MGVRAATIAVLAASQQLATAWPTTFPTHSDYAKIKTRAVQIEEEYDYIIVGGGTSGLTVGDRLTEDEDVTVLVIEEGLYHSQTGMNPTRMYDITSLPNPGLNDRTFSVGIGKAVGGSSIVNGQVFLRGTQEEYNAWAELGGPNSTWNWDGLLPYFKKGITLNPPEVELADEFNILYDMEYWGTESKIYGTFGGAEPGEIVKIMYSAMAAMPGMTIPEDSGAGKTGLYWYPLSQDTDYVRSYARTGHWNGIERDNYEMIVGAKVNKILFDGDDAVGVQFHSVNATEPEEGAEDDEDAEPAEPAAPEMITVKARKEVILAAGAVHTPQVLMLSGIGPAYLLEEAGIEVKVDLPGVGSNFQDHSYIPSIGYAWGNAPNVSNNGGFGGGPVSGGPPNLATMIGMPVVSPENFEALADAFGAQDPAAHLPESYTEEQIEGYKQQQAVWERLMKSPDVTFLEIMVYGPGGAVQNLHCMSRGNILIDPANPEGEMLVDYRAASNEIDLDVMVEIIKFMRRWMTTGELEQYEAREIIPGSDVESDEDLKEWARGQIIPSVYHPVGTAAKMPREWGGVLDEDLLVYGVNKLTVIDASMMPTTVGATTSMTVYAVAEKAADIIKARNA